jgi:hypothetical protein|tara:strand:- start:2293 stop:2715 length:423 start_codon:yes stop_codon:yes gene_type:complete
MLSSILVLFVGLAQADNGKFTYMESGQPCPFKGTLFDDEAMSHLLTQPEFEQELCNIQKQKELGLLQTECDLRQDELQSELDFHRSEIDRITKEKNEVIGTLEEELGKIKKNDNPLVFTTGVVIGVTVTYLLVKALGGTQ